MACCFSAVLYSSFSWFIKKKKKERGNLSSLCALHQSVCPDAAPEGSGMDTAPRLVTLIYGYTSKCTSYFSLHIAGGLLLREGGTKLSQRPGGSCVTHLCAGLLQQPKWQRDSQQAPRPGTPGCWPRAGVYPEWLQFKIMTELADVFCPKWRGAELSAGSLFFHPAQSLLTVEE